MEVLNHIDAATKANQVFKLPAYLHLSELTFFIVENTALIKSVSDTGNIKYDFVWSKGEQTSREVARKIYADRLAVMREGM